MISLFTYEDAKRLTEERRRRSLAIYESTRRTSNDTYVRPIREEVAEVVEVTFGAACSAESIGA